MPSNITLYYFNYIKINLNFRTNVLPVIFFYTVSKYKHKQIHQKNNNYLIKKKDYISIYGRLVKYYHIKTER